MAAQPLQNFEAIDAGKHDVQNDQIVGALESLPEPGVALVHAVRVEALALQEFLEQGAQLRVVVDNQQLHLVLS